MSDKALYATAHRIRFSEIKTPDMLPLAASPALALSWKIGPSGEVGPDGYRLPAAIWCAVGLYRELDAAQSALVSRSQFMPYLDDAVESWHALVQPFMHRGACNHLDRHQPDTIFDVSPTDTGGPCMVITTAGFDLTSPDFNIQRVIDFRCNVDATNASLATAEGCRATQVFTPHTVGDDGFTFSIWRDDAAMLAAAYRPGTHRAQLDRHNAESVMDRSSFTRCRFVETSGHWNGRDPAQL